MLGLGVWGWTWEVLGWGGGPVAQFETYLLDHAKLKKLQLTASEALRLHLGSISGYGCCAWADFWRTSCAWSSLAGIIRGQDGGQPHPEGAGCEV